MKIDSHRIEIEETCKPEYIEAIKQYWFLENNKFINKPKALGKLFGFSAYEFGKMIKSESKFFIKIQCDTCPKIESTQVNSQSNFAILKSELYDSKTKLFYCSKCKALKEVQRLEELENQKAIHIEKQNLAIKNQAW